MSKFIPDGILFKVDEEFVFHGLQLIHQIR